MRHKAASRDARPPGRASLRLATGQPIPAVLARLFRGTPRLHATGTKRSTLMNRRQITRALLAGAALLAAACSDAPNKSQLAPQSPVLSAGRLGILQGTVSRRTPLTADIQRTVVVTNAGGRIDMPEAGLLVTVPSNALPAGQSELRITVTAFKGSQVAYEFEPAGTVFRRPLQFEQNLNVLTLDSRLLATLLPHVSYFRSRSDLQPALSLATTYEDLTTTLSGLLSGKAKADIWHFSGYVVAWGRGSSVNGE
jgi:hypothetical protein